MRAVSRLGLAIAAAGLAFAPVPALAQPAPDPAANTPAPDAIGPKELQNFSLGGTATRPPEAPAAGPSASAPAQTRGQTQPPQSTSERPTSAAPSQARPAPRPPTEPTRVATAPPPTSPPPSGGEALTLDLPAAATPTPAPQPGFAPQQDSAAASLAPEQSLALWPWLLLAAVLGAGGAFLLWRRRSREAFAGGSEYDAYVAPEPAPAPRPAPPPAPRAAPPPPPPESAPPKPIGIVSSRLRPWVEIAFAPIGCTVDDERVTVEFEVHLTNSGSSPARDILVEASMFNAGATQEQDIGGFFANPVGQGERIQVLPPLQHVSIRTSLVAPRQNIQIFELGGHKVFVPLVAFNALYRLSSGPAQTSAAYLLGRETKSDKLGPFRVDSAQKAFAKLGAHVLPIGLRT